MGTKDSARFSAATLITSFLAILIIRVFHPPVNVLSWDVLGYYLYLPSIFIYNDLGIKDLGLYEQLISTYGASSTLYQVVGTPDGGHLFRYSMGMAILYLPFFLLAHLIALLSGFPADGLSLPYQYTMSAGGLIYTILGLILLRKVLKTFFSDGIVALILIALVFGTNYLIIASIDGLMPHNILFTAYALILWLTIRWHRHYKTRDAVLLGLVMGLTTLSRPTEIICLLIPVLWNIHDIRRWKEKWEVLKVRRKQVYLAAGAFVLAGLPQIIYWKVQTGQILFYSYGNPGEGFELLWPYTLKVLFSFRKGWLLYTPIMLFAIAGFFFMRRSGKAYLIALASFAILNIYLVSSWSCWYYAGSFSQRALVQSYPIMAVAMGFAVDGIRRSGFGLRIMALTAGILFILLNLFQSWQYSVGIIDGSRMTARYYFNVFGTTSVDSPDKSLLLVERSAETYEFLPDDLSGYRRTVIGTLDFEEAEEGKAQYYVTEPVHSGNLALRLDSTLQFSPTIQASFRDITDTYYGWIRASAWVFPLEGFGSDPVHLVVTFQYKGKNYKYRTASSHREVYQVEPGRWNKLHLEYMTPEVRTSRDKLLVYMWLQGKQPVVVDDVMVEAFVPEE